MTQQSERATDHAAAERGVTSVYRQRSLQSRISGLLPLGIMLVLGVGLLGWYYSRVASHARPSRGHAVAGSNGGDVPLPPLGPIDMPLPVVSPAAGSSAPPVQVGQAVTPGDAPTPSPQAVLPLAPAGDGASTPSAASKSPAEIALERRLSGPAFSRQPGASLPDGGLQQSGGPTTESPASSAAAAASTPAGTAGGLGDLLVPTATPTVRARELPTQRLLLAKGTFIDCTLETAIDSSLPGMTTCITATDTFSVDGNVVLLERGSKLVGETRGQVQQGASRLFVLWTEARTPAGVVVPLTSPGTDELGRSGVSGEVDRHFWQRFGAAILISVIDGGLQAATRGGGDGTVVYDTSSSRDVATEALRGTVGIAPTLVKPQGDRIQVLVARDLDFRSVYELKVSGSARP